MSHWLTNGGKRGSVHQKGNRSHLLWWLFLLHFLVASFFFLFWWQIYLTVRSLVAIHDLSPEIQLKIWSVNIGLTNKLIHGALSGKKRNSQMTMQEKYRLRPNSNIFSNSTQDQMKARRYSYIINQGETSKEKWEWKSNLRQMTRLRFLGLFKIPAPQGQSWPGRRNPWLSPDTNRGGHPKPSFYNLTLFFLVFPCLKSQTLYWSRKGLQEFDFVYALAPSYAGSEHCSLSSIFCLNLSIFYPPLT